MYKERFRNLSKFRNKIINPPICGYSLPRICQVLALIDLIFDITLLIFAIVVESISSNTVYFAIVLFPTGFFGGILNVILAATVNRRGHLVVDVWLVVGIGKSIINLLAVIISLAATQDYVALSIITIIPIPFRLYMIWVAFVFKKILEKELEPTKMEPGEIRAYVIPEIKIEFVDDIEMPRSRRTSSSASTSIPE